MRALTWGKSDQPSNLLLVCALVALGVEGTLLTLVGWHEHWLAHPKKNTGLDESQYLEAQVFEYPTEARLVEEKKIQKAPLKREMTLSKVPTQGKPAPSTAPQAEEENQTDDGPKFAPTHGPVALYAPPPVIPSYLQDQEFKTSVVIDFYVSALGAVSPRLIGSSGNEELDAVAMSAVKKWQFRPAEKDHKSIDAKVRLRIIFRVD